MKNFKNLEESFINIVSSNRKKPALLYENYFLSFEELYQKSEEFIDTLLAKGFKKGDVIFLLNDKSPDYYCLMITCIRLGIVYCNIDSELPIIRLNMMIETASPSAIIGETHIIEEYKNKGCTYQGFLSLKFENLTTLPNKSIPKETVEKHDIVYLMFTSGSTGTPKCVSISHHNLFHFLDWGRSSFGISNNDIFTGLNPAYFDNSVFDFYMSIFNGNSLIPVSRAELSSPLNVLNKLETLGATIWFSVPSMLIYYLSLKLISVKSLPSIRKIVFGGEAFQKTKLQELFELTKESVDLFNVYGPTECTCMCSAIKVTEEMILSTKTYVTLGRISDKFIYKIEDANGKSSHIGELVLYGPQVSPGYYQDQERTDISFGSDPHKPVGFQNFYRTGDLIEEDKNMNLHFRGRIDNQIKYLGYRIELEEIEGILSAADGVNELVVVYKRIQDNNSELQVLMSSSLPKDEALACVKSYSNNNLPKYMRPKKYVIVDTLPKSQNGKVDRKASARYLT